MQEGGTLKSWGYFKGEHSLIEAKGIFYKG